MFLDAAESLFKLEIAGEAAANLGRVGHKVEAALATLRACPKPGPERDTLLKQAADAVYNYMVQRELNGLTNDDEAIRIYRIPPEVLARVGIMG
jgi:hypothetical protein